MSEVPNMESVIKTIVLQTGLSREEINKKIDATIASFNGLLTKIGAALVVADKLNVKIQSNNGTETTVNKSDEMKIKDLVNGMKNIMVVGRVFKIYPSKNFTKKDGHDGKVASVLIQDDTGKARVSFWDRKTELVVGLKEADIIGVYNASVKTGFNGGIDINVGDRTNVKINPDNVDKSTFAASNAATGSGSTKRSVIKDITESTRFCSFKGTITEKFEPREFQKKDGTQGKLGKIVVKDETGIATVIFWTERMTDFDGLNEGIEYDFDGLTVKMNNFRKELEFYVNKSTRIKKV